MLCITAVYYTPHTKTHNTCCLNISKACVVRSYIELLYANAMNETLTAKVTILHKRPLFAYESQSNYLKLMSGICLTICGCEGICTCLCNSVYKYVHKEVYKSIHIWATRASCHMGYFSSFVLFVLFSNLMSLYRN